MTCEVPFEGPGDITPAEFIELKRSHGGDPFPMSATFEVISVHYSCSLLEVTNSLQNEDFISIFFLAYNESNITSFES